MAALTIVFKGLQLLLSKSRRLRDVFLSCGFALPVLLFFCGAGVLFTMAIFISMFFIVYPIGTIYYFFYILFGTPISESCFFMPCAPQSINDWDQAFSLTAGLILLICTEVVPGLRIYAQLKNRRPQTGEEESVERCLSLLNAAELGEMDITDIGAEPASGSKQEEARIELSTGGID